MKTKELILELTEWIREQVHEADARGVVLGMSGGLDSSIVGVLCKLAYPYTTLGLILPCLSQEEDLKLARMVATNFGITTIEINLSPIFTLLQERLTEKVETSGVDMASANLKPRLRMCCLYYYANMLKYLVVGTGNKSELSIGYFTKYGDGAVDILPLGDILKTEEPALAETLGIPKEIIERPPTAGLWEGQTDEDELGMRYADLDQILTSLECGALPAVDKDVVQRANYMMAASQHKRDSIPIYKCR
jgi:NAD+ synthase